MGRPSRRELPEPGLASLSRIGSDFVESFLRRNAGRFADLTTEKARWKRLVLRAREFDHEPKRERIRLAVNLFVEFGFIPSTTVAHTEYLDRLWNDLAKQREGRALRRKSKRPLK